MRSFSSWLAVLLLLPGGLAAQEAYKVEDLKNGPPKLGPDITSALNAQGYRILDGQGKPFADLWLRKSIPAKSKPSGTKGVIQFPFLSESELIGLMQLHGAAHDYRDQELSKGLYTLRYGHQPVNGDHLGVSPFGDYVLLLPAAKDKSLAVLPRKQLETQSAETAGSSHPAVLFMLAVPAADAGSAPSMINDAEKNSWRVVVPLNLTIQGEPRPLVYPVSIVVVGTSDAA
jgi:hypothetical protein